MSSASRKMSDSHSYQSVAWMTSYCLSEHSYTTAPLPAHKHHLNIHKASRIPTLTKHAQLAPSSSQHSRGANSTVPSKSLPESQKGRLGTTPKPQFGSSQQHPDLHASESDYPPYMLPNSANTSKGTDGVDSDNGFLKHNGRGRL